jgi:hypothetical protein
VIPDDRRGSDFVCGEPALCDRCGRLRGECEVASRSLRCLRSLSYFELAHQHNDVDQMMEYISGVL